MRIAIVGDYLSSEDIENIQELVNTNFPDDEFHVFSIVKYYNKSTFISDIEKYIWALKANITKAKIERVLVIGDYASTLFTGYSIINDTIGRRFKYSKKIDLFLLCKRKLIASLSDDNYNHKSSNYKKFVELIQDVFNYKPKTTNYILINDYDDVISLFDYIQNNSKYLCFDFETTGLDMYSVNGSKQFRATLLAITIQPGFTYAILLEHASSLFTKKQVISIIQQFCKKLIANPNIIKINQNIKYDFHVLNFYLKGKLKINGEINDTMLISHLLDETTENGLKDMINIFFPKYSGYDEEVHNYKWDNVPADILITYGTLDSDLTLRLFFGLFSKLMQDEKLYVYYRSLTMAVFKPLFYAECNGVHIDILLASELIEKGEEFIRKKAKIMSSLPEVKNYLEAKKADLQKLQIEELKNKINVRVEKGYNDKTDSFILKWKDQLKRLKKEGVQDAELNTKSPKQLIDFLFLNENGLKLKYDKRKKITTSFDNLQVYNHPFTNAMFAINSINKMISTYYKSILAKVDYNDFVHPNYLQHGTKTGRLSCINPNLQNVATRSKFNDEDMLYIIKSLKKIFSNPNKDKYVMLQADVSQAELRAIANFSGDPVMIDSYTRNIDIHLNTAAKLMNLSHDEVLKHPDYDRIRVKAKVSNFGLIYGAGYFAYNAYYKGYTGEEISEEEYKKHKEAVFKTFSTLNNWHAKYKRLGKKYGFVRTCLGRKRLLPEINSPDPKKEWEYVKYAINSPIQGTAGELTLFAIYMLSLRLNKEVIFFNTVHDSVFYYVPYYLLDETMNIIQYTFENLPTEEYFNVEFGPVKFTVDFEASNESWGAMKKLKNERVEILKFIDNNYNNK